MTSAGAGPGEVTQGRLVRDGVLYTLATFLQRGVGFLVLPIVTRVLGVEQFGAVAVALAVAAVSSIVLSLGATDVIVRAQSQEDASAPRAHWSGLLHAQVLFATVLAGLLLLTGPVWSAVFANLEWGPVLQLAVVFGLVTTVQTSVQSVLRSERRVGWLLISSLAATIGGALLGIVGAARYGPSGYVGGLAAGAVLGALVAGAKVYRRPLLDRARLGTALVVGLPFVLHGLSNWVLGLSDRVVIERVEGLPAVGRYQVAYTVAGVVFALFEGLQSSWAPYYYRLDHDRRQRMPEAVHAPATAAAAGLVVLGVLAAPLVVRVVAPAGYRSAPAVVAVVLAAAVTRPTFFLALAVLVEAGDGRGTAVASMVAAGLNVALNIVLVPTAGLLGAAIATFVAYGAQAVLVHRRARRHVSGGPPGLVLGAVWLAVVGIAVGAGVLPAGVVGTGLRAVTAVAAITVTVTAVRALARRHSGAVAGAPAPVAG